MPVKMRTLWSNWCRRLLHPSRFSGRYGIRRRLLSESHLSFQGAEILEDRVLLTTFTVTNGGDPSGTHSGMTLRDAITQANQTAGADTILFDSSINGSSVRLTQGQLNVTDSLTIRGNGAQSTIVDAQ